MNELFPSIACNIGATKCRRGILSHYQGLFCFCIYACACQCWVLSCFSCSAGSISALVPALRLYLLQLLTMPLSLCATFTLLNGLAYRFVSCSLCTRGSSVHIPPAVAAVQAETHPWSRWQVRKARKPPSSVLDVGSGDKDVMQSHWMPAFEMQLPP